jgi:glycosyltransferase involved in cell wall biosynthesis
MQDFSRTNTPLVSYCIPAYNHSRYVEACINSILTQSYPDVEVVVVDDCSIDSTYDIVRSFDNPRLRHHRNTVNVGPGETLNRCIKMAKGEFIALSGSDDVHLRDKTAIQVDLLRARPDVGAVFSTPTFIGPRGELLEHDRHPGLPVFPAFNAANRDGMFEELLRRGNFLLAPSAIIRRSVVDRVGLFDAGLIQLQDYDYWLRIAVESDLFVIDRQLVQYRMLNGSNLSSENKASRNRHHFELSIIFEKLAKPLRASETTQEVNARHDLMLAAMAHLHSRDVLNFRARMLYEKIANGANENNNDYMNTYRQIISENAIFTDRNPLIDFAAKLVRRLQQTIGRTK